GAHHRHPPTITPTPPEAASGAFTETRGCRGNVWGGGEARSSGGRNRARGWVKIEGLKPGTPAE
ncbi:unnamed protein product, partial [Ectocarpus sp. 4 AP-2014]